MGQRSPWIFQCHPGTGRGCVSLDGDTPQPECTRAEKLQPLHDRFEDPLADCKARDRIKTMRQGHQAVAEYTKEFCDLVCRLNDWPEDIPHQLLQRQIEQRPVQPLRLEGAPCNPP